MVFSMMRNGLTWKGQWNDILKLWVFRKMAKWGVAIDAPRLMATAVATDSHHHLQKRSLGTAHCQSKSFSSNDQIILRVDLNFATINYHFVLQNFRLRDREWCSTVDGNGSCYGLAPSSSADIAQIAFCRHQRHYLRWPGNPKRRSKFYNYCAILRNSTSTRSRPMLHGWRQLLEIARMAHFQCQKHLQWWPSNLKALGSKLHNYRAVLRNLHLRDHTKSLEIHLLAVWMPTSWWYCAMFFSYSHCNGFVLTYEKNVSTTWLPLKDQDIHIKALFFTESTFTKTIDILKEKQIKIYL